MARILTMEDNAVKLHEPGEPRDRSPFLFRQSGFDELINPKRRGLSLVLSSRAKRRERGRR